MPWMTGGKELHGFLKSSGLYPTILSALPSPDRKIAMANARKGKIEWLKKELGDPYANDAILCFRPEKALQSGSSRILIDDNSNNIREWEEAGGGQPVCIRAQIGRSWVSVQDRERRHKSWNLTLFGI
jgi:hypothetical protein